MEKAFYIALAPWLVFVLCALIAKFLMHFAKKRRGIAIVFGIFVQMFMPDPFVERTIETFIVEKRPLQKQRDGEMLDKIKK